jgi:prevent-host-death family protein
MKRVPLAEFKAHCSMYVHEAANEDIVITRHGRPVARVVSEPKERDPWQFLGTMRGKLYIDPSDDLLSTGREWDAKS